MTSGIWVHNLLHSRFVLSGRMGLVLSDPGGLVL